MSLITTNKTIVKYDQNKQDDVKTSTPSNSKIQANSAALSLDYSRNVLSITNNKEYSYKHDAGQNDYLEVNVTKKTNDAFVKRLEKDQIKINPEDQKIQVVKCQDRGNSSNSKSQSQRKIDKTQGNANNTIDKIDKNIFPDYIVSKQNAVRHIPVDQVQECNNNQSTHATLNSKVQKTTNNKSKSKVSTVIYSTIPKEFTSQQIAENKQLLPGVKMCIGSSTGNSRQGRSKGNIGIILYNF